MAATKKGGVHGGKPGRVGWSRRNFAPVLFLSIEQNGVFKDAGDLLSQLLSFRCKENLGKATETKFLFRNDGLALAEDPRFLGNTVWRFRFGYFNDLSQIFLGVVRNVEPDYSSKCTISVTLFDYSLNLSQTSGAKNWGRVQSSEIAKALAKKHGMKARVTPSNDVPKKAWIQPSDMNDLAFIRDLSAMIDFEFFVDGDPPTLVYRKKDYDSIPKANLTYYTDPSEYSYLKSFKPKVTSLGPYSSGVAGTDAGKGKGEASKNTDPSKANPGLAPSQNLQFSERGNRAVATVVSKKPVASPAPSNTEPAKLAVVKRQQLLDRSNEASSDHPLTPALSKGLIFNILGVEKPLQGKWYIQEASHELSGTNASTKVTWKRNATGGKKDMANTNNKASADGDKGAANKLQISATAGNNPDAKYTVVSPAPVARR